MHRPLSPLDAARLYRELKELLAEDAARRQRATRFGAEDGEEGAGGPDSGPPQLGAGKAARQAAQAIQNSASHTRLQQISTIPSIAPAATPPTSLHNEH